MTKRTYSLQQAYELMCLSGESSEEVDNSDSEFEPVVDSDTISADSEIEDQSSPQPNSSGRQRETVVIATQTNSEESRVPPAKRRHRHTLIPEDMASPVWSPANLEAVEQPPFTAQAGISIDTSNFSPMDFFQLIISDELLGMIVEQTNLYAQQHIAAHPGSSYAKPGHWKPTTIPEFRTFLGLFLNMGITIKHHYKDYWSKVSIHHMGIFSCTMSRTRFLTILRFLHFNDNAQCESSTSPNFDRLYKIRPLINYFSQKFPELYTPKKDISIEESLIHFTGRLAIKQYIPSKHTRYGVKMYKLCESTSGYTWSFRIYEGKDSQLEPPGCPDYIGTNGKVVWDLITPLLNNGYNLYLDNFYTSIPLFKHLFSQKTPACGTMRSNRKGFPQTLVNRRLERGESQYLHSNEMLAAKYKDKRDVYMLSTIHPAANAPTRRDGVQKPLCIHEYNQYMGGVDFNDRLVQSHLALRKSKYWYKKVAIYLIQVGIVNFWILHKKSTNSGTYKSFLETIVIALLEPSDEGPSTRSDAVARLSGKHYPVKIPPTACKEYPQKRCRVCSKQKRRVLSRYHCTDCPEKPGLCMKDCFQKYHSSIRF
ncbi:piggyBac transposable element-derived protein 4-like [Hyperolius riggenbachi]|uniref:piggyBac transposable element-derived protein 4-like n=1 Tax=Hyperolius riggenbachi TaxID=752182 RepID=UPI0035A31402